MKASMNESEGVFFDSETCIGPNGVILIQIFSGVRNLDLPFCEREEALTAAWSC